MTVTNDFKPFATGGGANVVDQATYAAAGYVPTGRGSGILPSNVYNKVARQGNFVAAGVAQFIADTLNQNVLDNGDLTAFVAQLAAAITASIPAAATTGDAKLTLKSIADSGWIMMDDSTIGDASSGATHASVDNSALFQLIWANVTNTWAPTYDSSGTPVARGVSAAADWAAHRRIALTKQLGRTLAISGAGSGLTARQLGQNLGEETHALTSGENGTHTHVIDVTNPAHTHTAEPHTHTENPHHHDIHADPDPVTVGAGVIVPINTWGPGKPTDFGVTDDATATINNTTVTIDAATTTVSATAENSGAGTGHNNMQPTAFWNVMIKL